MDSFSSANSASVIILVVFAILFFAVGLWVAVVVAQQADKDMVSRQEVELVYAEMAMARQDAIDVSAWGEGMDYVRCIEK